MAHLWKEVESAPKYTGAEGHTVTGLETDSKTKENLGMDVKTNLEKKYFSRLTADGHYHRSMHLNVHFIDKTGT